MAILSIQTAQPTGLASVNPSVIYISTNDTFATVTATGYLTNAKQEGFSFAESQMALVDTTDDGPVWLQVAITYSNASILSTVISLIQPIGPGSVILPTVAGQLAAFSDTSGTLATSGVLTANVMKINAVNTMAAGSSIILAKVNGVETGNAVTASGVAGVITTSALTTAGGANYAITWTDTFISAASVVLVTIAGGTNTTQNITLKVVPGAGSATLTIYNTSTATALNGTILISYLVM